MQSTFANANKHIETDRKGEEVAREKDTDSKNDNLISMNANKCIPRAYLFCEAYPHTYK